MIKNTVHQAVLRKTCKKIIVRNSTFWIILTRLLIFFTVLSTHLILPLLVRDAIAKPHSRKVYCTVERYPRFWNSFIEKRVYIFSNEERFFPNQISHLENFVKFNKLVRQLWEYFKISFTNIPYIFIDRDNV